MASRPPPKRPSQAKPRKKKRRKPPNSGGPNLTGKGYFQPGNQIWQRRLSTGPRPHYETPEDLWRDCCEYFEWSEKNPLLQDNIKHRKVELPRAMNLGGLCLFLGHVSSTWRDWRRKYPHLLPAMEAAEEVIRQQKFEGAAAGLFNSNIIARDIGLAERTETQMLDREGQPTDPQGPNPYIAAALAAVEKSKENG